MSDGIILLVIYIVLFVAFIAIILLIAQWSLKSQKRMLREDAERNRKMYERDR